MASELYHDDDKAIKELGFRYIRDLDAEPPAVRKALLDAVEDMANDDRELRDTA